MKGMSLFWDMEMNLISDTVTRPSSEMLQAMFGSKVGDDVFREDPTVNELEEMVADMFGRESSIFCPSGTMTNQIAIKVHTKPLDEIICEKNAHIYHYESAGFAFHSGVSIRMIQGENGIIQPRQLKDEIQPLQDWLAKQTLFSLENTANRGGGNFYTQDEMKCLVDEAKSFSLGTHLDGARIFNAIIAEKEARMTSNSIAESCKNIGKLFDSISICLSKGLGAPVGSLLIGDTDFIKEARRVRKVMGGGMRQSGYLAGAGIYALNNNINRLSIDHANAKILEKKLSEISWVVSIKPVKTNIVIFDVHKDYNSKIVLDKLAENGVRAAAFGVNTIRMVTHLDVSEKAIHEVCSILEKIELP
jgi:threonine aldolase